MRRTHKKRTSQAAECKISPVLLNAAEHLLAELPDDPRKRRRLKPRAGHDTFGLVGPALFLSCLP